VKIAAISTSQVPSTTANSIQAMKVVHALAQLGHEVTLLVPGTKRVAWVELEGFYGLRTPFAVEWLPSTPRLKHYDFCLAAVRRAKSLKADLVYAWPPQAVLLALWQTLPVVFEVHGPPEGNLGPVVFRRILKAGGKRKFLVISRALVDILERSFDYSFAPGEVCIAPNGVDLDLYADLTDPEQARLELNLPPGFTAGYTGHLYPGRGIGLLMELAKRFPQVNFLWVGGRTGDNAEWKGRLQDAGVSNVTLTGFVENRKMPLYQAASDVLLMPYERAIAGSGGGNSASYASPMKMFEYLACGRAILSSDLPVIREVLNEANAVLLPPEELEAWAQALRSLLDDPVKRQALAQQASQDAAKYTWQSRARHALEGFS
jgi:glycosyltransferase involved in cell wall biosynthesis